MKRIPLLTALALLFVAVGCDSTMSVPEATARFDEVHAAFRSARATPVAAKTPDGEQQMLLEVTFDPDAGIRLPEAVNVLPQTRGGSATAIWDNGLGVDRVAGDGIFTAVVPRGCVPTDDTAAKSGDIGWSCKVVFVPPGETCGVWGECPERTERSFLWGLIEYETDVVFCFCLIDCDFELKK